MGILWYLTKLIYSVYFLIHLLKDKIIIADDSIQGIAEIQQDIRNRYKTVWELKQKVLVDLSADRAPFVCQTQSLNIFIKAPTFKTLSSLHFYSWKLGVKTGIYYLRSQAKTSAQKFSVDLEKVSNADSKSQEKVEADGKDKKNVIVVVTVKEEPECLMCSS